VGVPARRPAHSGGGGSRSGGPSRSGDTQESIPPAPGAGRAPAPRTRFAALPQYASRRPVMGRVVHIIDSPDDAAALYVRLNREGQRNILGSSDADIEMANWRGDGGEGEPPMAWIRQGDGVVRFNFARFPRPNLGGYTNQPFQGAAGPVPGSAGGARPAPAPGGGGVIRTYARLPEHGARPPLYGPQSRVAYVITDLQEAQRIWSRLVAERQLYIQEHDGVFAEHHWSHDGGVGDVPIAWVRTGDGVIRFNLAKFTRPPAPGAPR
jgi:hypothetical protein